MPVVHSRGLNICVCLFYKQHVIHLIDHRWQTQGPWAESSPPPCFTQPDTFFLAGGSAKLSLNC